MPPVAHIFRLFRDLLFRERRCVCCAAPFIPAVPDSGLTPAALKAMPPSRVFCPACMRSLARQTLGYCPSCGEPAAWPLLPLAPCGHCLKQAPLWKHFFFHGRYEGLLRSMLLRFKFHNQPLLGRALGLLLAGHPDLRALPVDIVAPIPLHPRRLAKRGYNQALEIARPVAAALRQNAPQPRLSRHCLRRTRFSRPQEGLSRAMRMRNTEKIFLADSAVAGKRILLVDDVLTTGATLHAACDALLRAGAVSVSVAVVARTSKKFR